MVPLVGIAGQISGIAVFALGREMALFRLFVKILLISLA